jgi:hypothetical protein
MTTYTDLVGKLLRALKDPDQGTYDEDLCYDAIIAAHEAVLPWVSKRLVYEITSGSDGNNFGLPADVYEIQAVQLVSSGLFIPRATLSSGTARSNPYAENDWIETPSGALSLSLDLAEGDELRVYYLAYWSEPEDANDGSFVIEVPRIAHMGMVYYAASHCMLTAAVSAASLGQYKTRVDSGNPEHNPLKEMSSFFRQLFYTEMKSMPAYQKAVA